MHHHHLGKFAITDELPEDVALRHHTHSCKIISCLFKIPFNFTFVSTPSPKRSPYFSFSRLIIDSLRILRSRMAQYTSGVSDSTVLQILTECGTLSSHPLLLLNCRVL
jgi:hypothetical protein